MIQVKVKIDTLKREGRGFSIGELNKAGLTAIKAGDMGIRIDKRRRSVHKINIAQLKNLAGDIEKEVKKSKKKVKAPRKEVKKIVKSQRRNQSRKRIRK